MNRYVIGIGAQKAGTTWLADYLSHHKQVYMSPIKELHYFDATYVPELSSDNGLRQRLRAVAAANLRQKSYSEQRARMLSALADRVSFRSLSDYRRYFETRAGNKQIYCEFTPSYAVLNEEGFTAMRQLADDVKLIFLMRDPVDRFWSAARMYARSQNVPVQKIDTLKLLDNPQFSFRANYQRTLDAAYKAFNPEHVHVEFYERLFTPEAIQRISSFIGIDYVQPDFQKEVNKGEMADMPSRVCEAARQKLDSIYLWARATYGDQVPPTWRR